MKINVFDIGGTFVKYGIWDGAALHAMGEFPSCGQEGAERLIARLHAVMNTLGAADAIGICTRGQINCESGVVIYDPPHIIPGYTGTNLKASFADFGVPVAVENDVNCMALAEAQFFPNSGNGDLICLTYGTCVGGAIVRNGEVYHGANWSAGEFGMIYSGGRYYEDIASVSALVERIRAVDPQLDSGRKIAAVLDRPDIAPLVDAWVSDVADGLASLIHIFDPAAVITGGGFIENERVFERISTYTRQRVAPGFHALLSPARYGNRAGLIGAERLAESLL